jgi:hypothetical protein
VDNCLSGLVILFFLWDRLAWDDIETLVKKEVKLTATIAETSCYKTTKHGDTT